MFDRMSRRDRHTFFGEGIVAHPSFAEPFSEGMRKILTSACTDAGRRVHAGGTYVNMDGPAFSTRAESLVNRQFGFAVIGMTNLPEAKLAREAEIALATLAMVTDYDCWKVDEAPVTGDSVVAHLHANVEAAKDVLSRAIPLVPRQPDWPEHRSLDSALFTHRDFWPRETVKKLGVILDRFVR
jgi:5'-methylthioadenosine phosphorylase